MYESADLLRHRSLQARCVHPQGGWTEFARDDIEGSIPARFEKIAARQPDHLAVKARDGELTYRELDESANRLAHAILRQRGPAAEPVGVLAQQGVAAIVATLAVLKAGKFYVPLDPQYPSERLTFMLDDTDASLIVADRGHHSFAEELARGRISILNTEDDEAGFPAQRPALEIAPEALAGVFYTSGSTGRPKGIIYTHQYLLHNVMNYGSAFHVSPHDRWTWLHSCSFSVSATDIFCPLLHGATVCPRNVQGEGLAGLEEWLAAAGVTILHWMATPFRSFAATLDRSRKLSGVRLLVFGGEKLFVRDASEFRDFFSSNCIFVNRLGTTETGLFRVYFFDKDTPLHESLVPAGYAVPEKATVILDESGAELAPGGIGEIGVQSHYLTAGYWRQPEMTRDKFRNDTNGSGARLYLTGDLGQIRPDGCLEYFGRADSQVKVRGHRIETGEIEKVLREIDGVSEAVVKAFEKPSGETYLTGYFVAAKGVSTDESSVRRNLLARLPGYMIPAAIVRLDAFPRNANHKIDLAGLPAPHLAPKLVSDRYALPQTLLQQQLVELWQNVLDVRPIGIDDNFFELGGDSLLAMRMINRLQPLLDSILHVPPLFENPTIASFAEFLESEYQHELHQQMSLDDVAEELDAAGLDQVKLGLVRDEIATFPVASRSEVRQVRRNPSAIFVLAPARSGTTLLRVILGGHPQLFAPPELHLLSHSTMDERRSVISERLQRGRLDAAIQAMMTARDCSIEDAECIIRGYEDANCPVGDFYRQLQSLIAPRRLVDKTPIYVWHREVLERAEALFDEPLYIHLLRHPYGVVLSYEEMHMDQMAPIRRPPGVSLTEFAEALWLIAHQNILAFLARIPENRQTHLSFEDLVKQPRETISKVCQFLNIDLHPGMLEPYQDRRQRMTGQIRPLAVAIGDPKFHQHKDIDPAVADRWREVYHYDFLCAETWRVAERLGYSRARDAAQCVAT